MLRLLVIAVLIGFTAYWASSSDFHYRDGDANLVGLSKREQEIYWRTPEKPIPSQYTKGLLIIK